MATRLETVLYDQRGQVVCQGVGVVPKEEDEPCDDCKIPTEKEIEAREQKEWILTSDAYYHVNCLRVRLNPSDSYTLKLRVLTVDPRTPHINLIPTLEGGQLDFP